MKSFFKNIVAASFIGYW